MGHATTARVLNDVAQTIRELSVPAGAVGMREG